MAYSQNKEEEVILNYFNGQTGSFIDIGANDGIKFSNTRALAERGWKGVLIEPSPKAYAKLKEVYNGHKGFYLYNFAIGNKNGKDFLQESGALCSASDVGLVSTFHSHEMDRFKTTVKYEPVEVKVFKWKTFLNRLTIKEFEFISADCEGSEMDFLPDMDLSSTKLICLEHNGKEELKKQYLEVTSKYGLNKIIYESGENIIISR
jgi:FkbM family methyltransferase